LLAALGRAGAQTLDLEGLARHRGSVLGGLPEAAQPSQKAFESGLCDVLSRLDQARPVFVESESRRIGSVQMPDALLEGMRAGVALTLSTTREARVALLKEEYAHFFAAPGTFAECLKPLVELHGKARIARWDAMAAAGQWDALIAELLDSHYDPIYLRSLQRNFVSRDSRIIETSDVTPEALDALALELRAAMEDEAMVESR
jgi:tRNA 2-selenouridine synthase